MHFAKLLLCVGPLLAGLTSSAPLPTRDLTLHDIPGTHAAVLVPILDEDDADSRLVRRLPGIKPPRRRPKNNQGATAGSSRAKEALKKDLQDDKKEKEEQVAEKKQEVENAKNNRNKNKKQNLDWLPRRKDSPDQRANQEIERVWKATEKSPAMRKIIEKLTNLFEACMEPDEFIFWISGGDHDFQNKVVNGYPGKNPIGEAVEKVGNKCKTPAMDALGAEIKKTLGDELVKVVEDRTQKDPKNKGKKITPDAGDYKEGARRMGYKYWAVLSIGYARAASGKVAFVRPDDMLVVRPDSIWVEYERPELKKNFPAKVTEVKEQMFKRPQGGAVVNPAHGFYDPTFDEDHDFNKLY